MEIRERRRGDRLGNALTWLTGGALAVDLMLVLGLVGVLAARGLGTFWPARLLELRLADGRVLLGEERDRETVPGPEGRPRSRLWLEVGNRDLTGRDFLWIEEEEIVSRTRPHDAVLIERTVWGDFVGYVRGSDSEALHVETADGVRRAIPQENVLRVLRPNDLSWAQRIGIYFTRFGEFLVSEPRESNTEGGIFPAIFGTVLMVLLMSVAVLPLGVLAAVFMHEYAGAGRFVRLVRISVNNLAGVPSIVFGIFGLGFFVYGIGGTLDWVFHSEALPTPTYGTGGILWASLTLALLTLPVVIVATEEGLSAVPRATRDGSRALGATQFETLRRVVVPAAAPGILTGLILAVARAAGEVAPLMIVGMVKLAPALPVDGQFPFLHVERKFMHLGFHIYDLGFQSPNVEAVKPLVFATAFLLVALVLVLNLTAIVLRNHLRRRYATRAV